MSTLNALVLAVVQGATEFLPVSSSGHLAICGKLLGIETVPLEYAVTVHFGTILSVIAYYHADLKAIVLGALGIGENDHEQRCRKRRLFWLLMLGTVPAAVAGWLLEEQVERLFGDIRLVGVGLIATAVVLTLISRLRGKKREAEMGWREALIVGMMQALALPPGVSRSGMTIAGALMAGLERAWAVRFAFLLSVPVVLGGSVLEAVHVLHGEASAAFSPWLYLAGTGLAAASGYAAIALVTDSVRRGNLLYFALYCLGLGLAAVFVGPAVGL